MIEWVVLYNVYDIQRKYFCPFYIYRVCITIWFLLRNQIPVPIFSIFNRFQKRRWFYFQFVCKYTYTYLCMFAHYLWTDLDSFYARIKCNYVLISLASDLGVERSTRPSSKAKRGEIEILLDFWQSQARYLCMIKDVLMLDHEGKQRNSLTTNSTKVLIELLCELWQC